MAVAKIPVKEIKLGEIFTVEGKPYVFAEMLHDNFDTRLLTGHGQLLLCVTYADHPECQTI